MSKAVPPDLSENAGRGKSLARRYPRGLRIDPHSHDWAQVLYAVAGVMWVEVGRQALVVPPQRAVWLPPDTVHSIRMMSAVEMRNLYLRKEDVKHLSKQPDVFEINGLLRELITAIAEREAQRDEIYLDVAYRFAALELAHASRYSLRIPLPDGTDRRLEVLCHAVIENPSADISFEQHAASVGASVRTLARLFFRALGIGFGEWRRQVQLAMAVSRIAEGQSVSTVARALGYQPSSFSDMFRRELGTSPSEFGTEDVKLADGSGAPDQNSGFG
ncbi:HTH-type transcriptional regulator NimR [Paraburkholderia kirstenboschensis]|uniref:AraC family transcriptional regulator n=1 Tax=Paraburkholderia kirstenboschensis TaxID=1245436 RepID=UPI000A7B1D66|nr:helix-turn-helix transcriptional regulator [Paraburkholderia kirstenboschensis]CAD6559499.1 HTH-type transcriptional regulator NimR [Paraburkholderia kirstenboschensis]